MVLPQCLSTQFGHFSTFGKSHSANRAHVYTALLSLQYEHVYVTVSPPGKMTDFGVCKIKLRRFLIAAFRTTGSEKRQNCSLSVSFFNCTLNWCMMHILIYGSYTTFSLLHSRCTVSSGLISHGLSVQQSLPKIWVQNRGQSSLTLRDERLCSGGGQQPCLAWFTTSWSPAINQRNVLVWRKHGLLPRDKLFTSDVPPCPLQ